MVTDLFQFSLYQREKNAIVTYDRGAPVTWSRWFSEFQALRQRLESEPLGFWPVYCKDTYPASLALFALWSSGRVPVLLPDTAQYTLEGIDVEIGGHLSDQALNLANHIDIFGHATALNAAEEFTLDCQARMQTSGTTGKPLIVPKTHRQIVSEVQYYAKTWHDDGVPETFAATVSHQHIYGLLFKLLVPMAVGQAFVSELLNNPRQLLGRYGEHDLVWVASPAQLKRTNAEIMADLPTGSIKRIYSSGGLLEAESAAQIRTTFAQPAIEVYGSTETGGIGWRQQHQQPENPWRLFSVVEGRLNADGLLELRSELTGQVWMATGDRVELFTDGRFNLLGRADRVVKLEEKRVSLTALETTLKKSAEVLDGRIFLLDQNRQQLAAVVVLSDVGIGELLKYGRKTVVTKLKSALGSIHPAHEVPRRFRFVSELPHNSQGKTTLTALAGEFQSGHRETLPYVQSVRVSEHVTPPYDAEVVLNLLVPPDLDYFPNHFADYHVLPGVVQLLWVRHFARLHLGISGNTQKMTKVKFKSMIHPGDDLTMTLRWRVDKSQLYYQIEDDGIKASGLMWGD